MYEGDNRYVWIAPIAWSRTSLDTQRAVMCVCFQRVRVRCNANYVPYAQMPACRVGLRNLHCESAQRRQLYRFGGRTTAYKLILELSTDLPL